MADTKLLAAVALLGGVVVAVAGAGLWLAADGTDDDAPAAGTELRSCTAIEEPGRYVLAADITDSEAGTCLRVRSSDVVLDGAGHTVDGVGAFGSAGVVVRAEAGRPLSNVTVRNLTATDWDDGIRYIGVEGGRIVGTTAADSRVGLDLLNSRQVTLVDNVARDNRLRGIAVMETSANNTLRNNTATDNAVYGIHLVEPGVRHNTLVDNTAAGNEFGLVLIGAQENELADNVAADNAIAGIWLSTASENALTGNAVSGQFYGVFLSDRSTGNAIESTVAESNRVGIRLRAAHDNAVTDNTIRSSGDAAILLIASRDNRVAGNAGSGNARSIVLVRSDGNVVEGNAVG